MSTVPFERPPTAQEAVLAELRRMLVTGELAPGSPIRQEVLAERLGVSRVPLREALKVLEGEGQVGYAAHRGYSVTELSVDDLVEVYRMRELLEAEAILQAMALVTDDVVTAMRTAAAEVDAAGLADDVAEITAANRRLHFLLFDAAAMPRLSRTLRQLWDATDVYRSVYFAGAGNRDRVHHEHDALLAAVARRDGEAAVAVQAEHRANSVAAVTAALTRA